MTLNKSLNLFCSYFLHLLKKKRKRELDSTISSNWNLAYRREVISLWLGFKISRNWDTHTSFLPFPHFCAYISLWIWDVSLRTLSQFVLFSVSCHTVSLGIVSIGFEGNVCSSCQEWRATGFEFCHAPSLQEQSSWTVWTWTLKLERQPSRTTTM